MYTVNNEFINYIKTNGDIIKLLDARLEKIEDKIKIIEKTLSNILIKLSDTREPCKEECTIEDRIKKIEKTLSSILIQNNEFKKPEIHF